MSDLEVLSRYIQTELSEECTNPLQAYILARDQVVFKALFFPGDRAADLLGLLTHTILRFPDNSGLLFNQGCIPLVGSGSGFLICDVPFKQILFQISDLSNPLWTRIHRITDLSDLKSDHRINDPAHSFW